MIFCLTVISVREFIQIIQICECIFLGFGTSLEALTTIIVFVNQLHDEGYSRNVSCALILISMFLLQGFIANYSNSVMYIFRLQDRRLVTH